MIISRLARGLIRQDWSTAGLELVILVVGIYIGLQVDDWASQRQDRQAETTYLELLARDVAELQQEAADQLEFERHLVATGTRALTLLNSDDPAAHRAELKSLLPALASRRTLFLTSATFEQMVSSGHLQLIRDTGLRDKIVRQFARMERDERVMGKNNQDLVDRIYSPFLLEAGITVDLDLGRPGTEQTINRASEIVQGQLGPDFKVPPDEVLSRPADARSWSNIRRNVFFRMQIAAIGQSKAETIAAYLEEIAAELEQALAIR